MNDRARDLMVTQSAILGTLPGARSVSFHAFEAWAITLITASSDEAMRTLGEDLGLGEVAIVITADRWWRYMRSDRDEGRLRLVVSGPHHMGSPPHDENADADASSRSE